jgi:hypothetical protein
VTVRLATPLAAERNGRVALGGSPGPTGLRSARCLAHSHSRLFDAWRGAVEIATPQQHPRRDWTATWAVRHEIAGWAARPRERAAELMRLCLNCASLPP